MARPKEFDKDAVLAKAVRVFWEKGYEATTTDDLVGAMGIGKQSMYDTFGDKRALYLAALSHYHVHQVDGMEQALPSRATPLQVLTSLLAEFSKRGTSELSRGCMGINATAAFALTEPEVLRMAQETARRCEGLFARLVTEAQLVGDLPPGLDPKRAGRFLYTVLQGLTIRAQAGASAATLDDAATLAIGALHHPR